MFKHKSQSELFTMHMFCLITHMKYDGAMLSVITENNYYSIAEGIPVTVLKSYQRDNIKQEHKRATSESLGWNI